MKERECKRDRERERVREREKVGERKREGEGRGTKKKGDEGEEGTWHIVYFLIISQSYLLEKVYVSNTE